MCECDVSKRMIRYITNREGGEEREKRRDKESVDEDAPPSNPISFKSIEEFLAGIYRLARAVESF